MKKSKTTRPVKSVSRFKRYRSWLLYGALALGFYLFILHHQIAGKFEGRLWNLPSRVYSEAVPLFDGQMMTPAELQDRLEFLAYYPVKSRPSASGQYRREQNHFEVFLHDFDYPHASFKGTLVSFDLLENHIRQLRLQGTSGHGPVYLEPQLIASVYDKHMEDRSFIKLEKIPRELVQGVILIEDERFYSHFGVDPIGLARAMLVNLMHGGWVQGGSTLTQQLVKNYFLHQRKTLFRKFNEMLMALIMEFRYTKNEILEAYFNEVYFGQRGAASIAGVGEGARFYFSKNVEQLLPHESALLAALVKSPGLYSPFKSPDRARERRNLILTRLLENKVITQKQFEESARHSLPQATGFQKNTNAPHFVEFVKKQLEENYPREVLAGEGLRIFTTLDMFRQRAAEKVLQSWLNRLENDRAPLKKNATAGKTLEAALIALQPGTGFVQAYVGGRDFGKNMFDHVSQAKRQPGSTFKPFVFAAALLEAVDGQIPFTPATIIPDHAIHFATPQGRWSPKNYDHKFHGNVRLRVALENSYNVATTWLANEIGLEKVVHLAHNAGIGAELKAYPALGLGTFEVTPLELAQAYTVFANQGVRSQVMVIRRVVTRDGEVLEKKSFATERVMSREVAYLMSRMLNGVLDRGTAQSARARGFYKLAAGKTGTTSDERDAWFVGYTPDHLSLVWTGYDDNSKTGLTGASGALPIWTDYMKAVTEGRDHGDFLGGENVARVLIDKESGLLYDSDCEEPIEEYFIAGTEPDRHCSR